MKILKLKYKNFKSYGNSETTIDFTKDFSEKLVILVGKIGSGKSSLREILEYAIYGKVQGFKLSDLPNRSNQNLKTFIEFESKGKNISIERGISPNVFKLLIDNKEYTQSGKKDIQDYIESELFDIPYHVFKNTVSISIDTFKSLLNLSPKDKKDVVDKILSFDIINDLSTEVKQDKKAFETELFTLNYNIESNQKSLDQILTKKYKLEQDISKRVEQEKIDFSNSIKELESQSVVDSLELTDLIKKLEKADSMIYKIESNTLKTREIINSTKGKLSLYNNNKCPTCGTDLATDIHENKKEEYKETITKETQLLKDFENKKVDIKDKQIKISNRVNELKNNSFKTSSEISGLKSKLIELNKNVNGELSTLDSMIDFYHKSISECLDEMSKIKEDERMFQILDDMFLKGSLKQTVMKNILPMLNRNIEDTFKNMSINFKLRIDETFDCCITSFGKEISIGTLSTGEKRTVDLAIVLSLLKIVKLTYPSLNVLFLDEIFSNMDGESINDTVNLVKHFSKELGLTTFLVSHTPVQEEQFDKKITVEKFKTFTKMKVEDI